MIHKNSINVFNIYNMMFTVSFLNLYLRDSNIMKSKVDTFEPCIFSNSRFNELFIKDQMFLNTKQTGF